ncbi:Aste57867_1521 [Aphanomyces stellatus]|uniref:Aste57867_1521 protein n=1 Tax=Aphanomyces stellatus TaxID=120398 RepID=A0A485KAI9_9STRA|nr:hypothetical protein As57867_001520 [Aphanomyces stellatus]VFT78737.1 Aste57867_1521 [Aphanomyces stellatus]
MPTRFKDTLPTFYGPPRKLKSPALRLPPSEPQTPPPSFPSSSTLSSPDDADTVTPPYSNQLHSSHLPLSKPRLPPPRRPSLSDQLASIGASAQALVDSLSKPTNDPLSFTLPTLRLVVGRLECKFPSPVSFSPHLLRYQFLHGGHDIAMLMYFQDMVDVTFHLPSLSVKFKIPHPLTEFAHGDYDHLNRNHMLHIGFASATDLARAKAFLQQHWRKQTRYALERRR